VAAEVAGVAPELFVGVEVVAREKVARQRVVAVRRRAEAVELHVGTVARLAGPADPVRPNLLVVGDARRERLTPADAFEADIRHLLSKRRRRNQGGDQNAKLYPSALHSVIRSSM